MFECASNFIDTLDKLGHKSEVYEIKGGKVLVIGSLPPNLDLDNLFEIVSRYRRNGADCFDRTEEEIKNGKADGAFINSNLPRHILPAIKIGEAVAAYDDPLLTSKDRVIFVGNEAEVSKSIEDFFSISHPYGKGYTFQEKI
jgi:hypothetical protein